jgi:hypothetical protein
MANLDQLRPDCPDDPAPSAKHIRNKIDIEMVILQSGNRNGDPAAYRHHIGGQFLRSAQRHLQDVPEKHLHKYEQQDKQDGSSA